MVSKYFIEEMENYLRSVPLVPISIVKGGRKCDNCGSLNSEIFFDFADSAEILALHGIGRENFTLPPDEEGDIYIQKSLCLTCFKKWFDDKPSQKWHIDYDYIWLRKIIAESDATIEDIKRIAEVLKTRFYFVGENLYVCGCGFVSGTPLETDNYFDVRDGLIDIHNSHLQECSLE